MTDRRLRIEADRSIKDIGEGDCVRWKGHRGVGFVESLTDASHAWVVWKDDRKDLLPLVALRRTRAVGHEFDSRRWIP